MANNQDSGEEWLSGWEDVTIDPDNYSAPEENKSTEKSTKSRAPSTKSKDNDSDLEVTVLDNGGKEYRLYGQLHREDGPARIYKEGEAWYKQGKLHRVDGPAVIFHNGHCEWWLDGSKHRQDDPAVVFSDGTEEWYKEGVLHRVDGPAVIVPNQKQEWYQNGKLHRIDGPAFILSDIIEEWYKEGKLHRENGPARIVSDKLVIEDNEWKYRDECLAPEPEPWTDWSDYKKRLYTTDKDTYFGGEKIIKEEWYQNGQLHRDDGPAIILCNGVERWYKEGKLHREDGPAFALNNGFQEWYKEGMLHRQNGPARYLPIEIELECDASGECLPFFEFTADPHEIIQEEWHQDGLLHREGGPAVILRNGTQMWYQDGEFERSEQPPFIASFGVSTWWDFWGRSPEQRASELLEALNQELAQSRHVDKKIVLVDGILDVLVTDRGGDKTEWAKRLHLSPIDTVYELSKSNFFELWLEYYNSSLKENGQHELSTAAAEEVFSNHLVADSFDPDNLVSKTILSSLREYKNKD